MEQVDRDGRNSAAVTNPEGLHDVVLVCEHASAFIPDVFQNLGLSHDARYSHIAWDPGALITAQHLSSLLDATLVHSCVSRLVYDCNRPPNFPSAMPTKSEIHEIPGNRGLTDDERDHRVQTYYVPFRDTLATTLERRMKPPVVVTIHSFTSHFHGKPREVEIGILHDADTRLADALLEVADQYIVRRNEPYGPDDGVTHTLKVHAIPDNYLNVMIEIRNDLLQTQDDCESVARSLATWLEQALANTADNSLDQAGS